MSRQLTHHHRLKTGSNSLLMPDSAHDVLLCSPTNFATYLLTLTSLSTNIIHPAALSSTNLQSNTTLPNYSSTNSIHFADPTAIIHSPTPPTADLTSLSIQ